MKTIEKTQNKGEKNVISILSKQCSDLDLRKEKDEDYSSGFLFCLQQLDRKNHHIFIIPDDRFGDRLPKGYKVLGSLVDKADWGSVSGKVAVTHLNGSVSYGRVAVNSLHSEESLILLADNKNYSSVKCRLKDIVAVYRLERIISGLINQDIDPPHMDILPIMTTSYLTKATTSQESSTQFMYVEGRSNTMHPRISGGDSLAVRPMMNWQEYLVWGEIYVIKIWDTVLITRLSQGRDDLHLVSIPDNKLCPKQDIPIKEIKEVSRVVGIIKRVAM